MEERTHKEWDDERTDIIGQNGNDGLHYSEELGGQNNEHK